MLDFLILLMCGLILGAVAPWAFVPAAIIVAVVAIYYIDPPAMIVVDVAANARAAAATAARLEAMHIYVGANGMVNWVGCAHGPEYTR